MCSHVGREGEWHSWFCIHVHAGTKLQIKLPRSQRTELSDLQDSDGVPRFVSWEKSLRRIFIHGESKCFMDSGWHGGEWFYIWGIQLLNRDTICQFWFQFYKHYLFQRVNLCEHECPNETWHFPLLNAPSLGKGSERVHKTSHGIWGSTPFYL